MSMKFVDPVRTGLNRLEPVLAGLDWFFVSNYTKNGTFFIKSRMSKPNLAVLKLLTMSMNFVDPVRTGLNRLEPVLAGLNWFFVSKYTKNGTFFIKSRRSKPTLEHELFGSSYTLFEQAGTGLCWS
ncbi:hypothetical protein ACJMK2_043917 [Sinanodonta woodiana]|uniref:LAGLIDADG endonuclease n=1 Tax=Sinanodonta woodiana TaxID=1069815 RepID=A0ABD3W176_SINWO